MTLRFDHMAIPVVDAASARELFSDILGLPLLGAHCGDDWDGAPWLMMFYGLDDGGQIALCALAGRKPGTKPATDLPHYAFAVRDRATLGRWRRKLADAGLAVRDEDHGRQQSIYFEDRSGTTWEITAPPSRNEVDRDAASVIDAWIARNPRSGRS
jgi:catechol 2,3-dioxygenase-like lactoylglutathione lyase family enzyme